MQSVEDSLIQQNNKAESLIQSNNKSLLQPNNEDQSLLQPNDDIESITLCFSAASNLYSELVIPDEDESVSASKRSYEASDEMFIQLYHRSLTDSHERSRGNNSSINVRFASNPLRHRNPPEPASLIQRHQRRIARLDSVIDQVINRAQLRNQDVDR